MNVVLQKDAGGLCNILFPIAFEVIQRVNTI